MEALEARGYASVHEACEAGDVDVVRAFATAGGDVNAVDKDARTPLHIAAKVNRVDLIKCLLELGANASAAMGRGWTALHYASRLKNVEAAELLVRHGADVNASMDHGLSVAHVAGDAEVLKCLVERGARLQRKMSGGVSVLQLAVRELRVDVVRYLVEIGADVEASSHDRVTILHDAAARNVDELVQLFLSKGASAVTVDRKGRVALHRCIWGPHKKAASAYSTAKILCSHGARWHESCEKDLSWSLHRLHKSDDASPPKWGVTMDKTAQWRTGIRACVLHWQQQFEQGDLPLADIPVEVVQRGEESVATYLEDMKNTARHQLILRRKICVVGPSRWGKTSLVKSLTSMRPTLEHVDDRTIGIDLFSHTFTQMTRDEAPQVHEVTFWDFAGQDEYQVAHTLFFSKRTLYLLCVDLDHFDGVLKRIERHENARRAEVEMSRFLRANVFRWVRAIVAHQPDAEFVIVGTKADMVDNQERIQTLWMELRGRLDSWLRGCKQEIQLEHMQLANATTGASDEERHLETLTQRLETMFAKDMLIVSSADQSLIEAARRELEVKITESDRSFAMPAMYTRVLNAIRARQSHAARLSHAQRIAHTVVPFQALCRSLMHDIDGLEPDECRDILQTLHDVGDLLWYQHEASGVFKDTVIVDPTLVLDFMREVITHEYASKTAELPAHVVEEGRLTHAFLRELPLWRDADEELLFAFKQLLQYFQLAYPADGVDMDWDSDLIVPTYWKISIHGGDVTDDISASVSSSTRRLAMQPSMVQRHGISAAATAETTAATDTDTATAVHYYCWEYELSPEVSETVFEQFTVQSYSSLLKRSVLPNRIETFVQGECAALMTLSSAETNTNRDLIRIDVAVADKTVGWQYLRYYVMALETVLDGYPGLVVSRYVVDTKTNDLNTQTKIKITRHRLSTALSALEDALWMGRDESSVREAMPWLPQEDLRWYVERAWREPGALHQLRTQALVREAVNKVDVLRKLVAADDTRRRYPALWTLAYDAEGGVMELRMLSDLSGDCFHDPISIAVPSSFFAKRGDMIKTGLSILSNIVPEFVSLGILEKIVKSAATAVSSEVGRSTAVHSLIGSLGVSDAAPFASNTTCTLSPRGTVALLRDLLRLHDPTFDDLMISDLSKLQCAATADGHYIWAHRQEIMTLGDKLTPCDADDLTPRPRSLSDASIPSTTSTASAASHVYAHTHEHARVASTARCVHEDESRLGLRIVGIAGLTPWDWRKVCCSWELAVDSSDSTSVSVSASTPPHVDNATEPTWSALEFTVPGLSSLEALRRCLLRVRVKRPSRCLGIVKQIGHGSVRLADVLPREVEHDAAAYSVMVPIDEGSPSSRYVTCELKFIAKA